MKARPKRNSMDAITHYEVAFAKPSCCIGLQVAPHSAVWKNSQEGLSSKSWKSGWLEWTPIFAVTVILKLDGNSQMRINAPCIYRLRNSRLNIKVVRNEIQVNRSTQCLQLRHTFFLAYIHWQSWLNPNVYGCIWKYNLHHEMVKGHIK